MNERVERQGPVLGEGLFIGGWNHIGDLEKTIMQNNKHGISTVVDFENRPHFSSEAEAKTFVNWQVLGEYQGARVSAINVHPADRQFLLKRGMRYLFGNREAAAKQLVIDDVVSRILQKIRSLNVQDDALKAFAEEEVDADIADDVVLAIKNTRQSYRTTIDRIGTHIQSFHEPETDESDGSSTDMVLLNRMLKKFGTQPDQLE